MYGKKLENAQMEKQKLELYLHKIQEESKGATNYQDKD